MNLPKVAVYSSNILPISETFVREQVLALRRWQPVMVGERKISPGLDLAGVDVHILRPGAPLGRFAHSLCRLLGVGPKGSIARFRHINARLVHAHFGTSAVDIWPVVRKLSVPMLVTLHGYDINIDRGWWESGNGGDRRRSYPRRLLALAQQPTIRFIAVSQAIRERAVAFGIPSDRIAVRYIGTDVNQFQPGPTPIGLRNPRVLFVGRLVAKKGVEYLIRAFAELRKEVPQAELAIVGDGPLRSELEHQAQYCGVPAAFLGSLSARQIAAEMHQSRILCLPSVTAPNGDAEGFGMVLLEAQSCGLPVVTSARGGSREGIVDGETGFAFPEGDYRTLAEHLLCLLTNSDLLERMSAAAVTFVRSTFDLHRLTSDLEDEYDRMPLGPPVKDI